VKTKEFSSLTRSLTLAMPVPSCEEFATVALTLCRRVDPGPQQLYRLAGVGLSNFQSDVEIVSPLFSEENDGEASMARQDILLAETGE
jgi:DNA polymerase IV